MSKDRILIADDNEINRKLLPAILGSQYDYVFAEDGLEILDVLEENSIDLILLDIVMPKLDGFEVMKILKRKQYLKEIPVIVISAESDAGFISRAYELGATDYITRPFDSNVVNHRVRNTLMLYSNQKRLVHLVQSEIYEREKINNTMINVFSNIIELRNHESGSHTLHVQTITNLLLHELMRISNQYALTESDISRISSLSALHDIGKIRIPEEILNKPGKLTKEEWEIMKTHTIEGYKILKETLSDQDSKFMETAKAICRWHHEKYDGRGYPDGLVGDQIPISAQVVSLADVYDALTSQRCYKRAYSHEEAIQMILNGECGQFNPDLLVCLRNISGILRESLRIGIEQYDYHKESQHMVDEILSDNNLPVMDNTSYLVKIEKDKREFFEDKSSSGILFDYDKISHRVDILNNYENGKKRRMSFYSSKKELPYLSDLDYAKFLLEIGKTTREHDSFHMDVLVTLGEHRIWHRLFVKTIWEDDTGYTEIIGQFHDIDQEISLSGLEKDAGLKEFYGILSSLRKTFPLVRLVDPNTSDVLVFAENGILTPLKEKCYEIWNSKEPCQYCSSKEALTSKSWMSKLEVKDGKTYAVLSKFLSVLSRDVVLEVAFPVDDHNDSSSNRCRLMSSLLFLNFYKDSLTKAYTRTYLDDFSANLANSEGVALLDVDHFKKINDTYGHPIGDVSLKKIAQAIREVAGEKAVMIRYGGDEFLLIFQTITEKEFLEKLSRIPEKVHEIVIPEVPKLKLSISVGGAYKVGNLNEAITFADKAMYQQKSKRRHSKK